MIQRRKVIIGTIGAAAAAATAGGSAPGTANASIQVAAEQAGTVPPPPAPVLLNVVPASGATGVSPAKPIVVTVESGTLRSVTVTAGKTEIDGSLQADGSWQSSDDLAYGKSYKVTATAVDSSGAPTEKTSTFKTMQPSHVVKTTFRVNAMTSMKAGHTYGAGQPVIISFSRAVDKKVAEKAIDITTSPSVEGKFYWSSDTTVHWRPAKYWAKGTKIKVNVNTLGVRLGKGLYGEKNASTHFNIGRQLIAIADNRSHLTKVYVDGKLVRTMKSSFGKGGGTTGANGQRISYWTAGGPHVVLSKERKHSMSSASYGITDPNDPNYYDSPDIEFCTRITYSGEFLHAAPWNGSLGRANLSHGCVNLSTSDARWVYENFLLGDVVDVTHSPRKLHISNGLGDWTVPFDKYGRD
ncbi:L,D-transpeptidase [Actinoplanes regularis]|uniref:Lipoprotein-anchoring transpeptidase ErfK/SrfK n=1 Tax=Actinoplanes regularis TaxID=52697 RepID=A0A238W0F3_9ACTN|nr:Ig-like domain-containing protein [Actinoplanes regularis]GIE85376.1 L,D-transpeptidase 2 [Actinoplanes regularis]SNR40040.1 Lipoprotein-anchoring transpeptidase ErfK/SrfK [Actinoplanes regularis]